MSSPKRRIETDVRRFSLFSGTKQSISDVLSFLLQVMKYVYPLMPEKPKNPGTNHVTGCKNIEMG